MFFPKTCSIFCIAFLWFALQALAVPAISTSPVPSWVIPVVPGGKPPSAKEFSEGYYVAFRDKQINLDKKSTFFRSIRQVVTETGIQNGSEISVAFEPSYERVEFHNVIVWRQGKAISQLKVSDFKVMPVESDRQRFIYYGYYTASLILKDIRKGDRIEYSYSTTGWNPVFQNKYSGIFDFGVSDYVPHTHFAVSASETRQIFLKEFNHAPKKKVSKQNGNVIYEWDLKDIKHIDYEDFSPSWYYKEPYVQVTDFKDWGEVVKWGSQYYQIPPVTGGLKAKIDEWKKNADSRHRYIELASRFVQDEIRYLGVETGENSHRPHRPDEVFSQRYGDCKDKALLLCAILRANDIECDPVLVNTYKRSHLGEYLPSPADFNHVICRVRTNAQSTKIDSPGEYTFIDATYSLQGGTATKFYLPPYASGLILREGQRNLVSIPIQNSGNVSVEEEITVPALADTTGKGAMLVKTIYFEGEADVIRSQFQQDNISKTEEGYLNYFRETYKHAKFEMLDTLSYYDQRDANNFSLLERYSMKNGWSLDSIRHKYIFKISGKMLYDQLIILPNTQRREPVSLKYPYHLEYKIRLRLPGPWNVPTEDFSIKRDSYQFSFKSVFNESDNIWELIYEYQTLKDHVTAAEVAQFRKDMDKIAENLEYELTNPEDGSVAGSDINYWMIVVAVLTFLGAVFFCFRLYQFTPLDSEESHAGRPIGGWLIALGFGLALRPVILLVTFFGDSRLTYFTKQGWNYFQGQSEIRIIGFQSLITVECLVNIFIFCASILLIILFFQRRNSFPFLFAIIVGCSLLFVIADSIAAYLVLDIKPATNGTLVDIGRQILFTAAWISYVYRSERVKQTFTEGYSVKLPEGQAINI